MLLVPAAVFLHYSKRGRSSVLFRNTSNCQHSALQAGSTDTEKVRLPLDRQPEEPVSVDRKMGLGESSRLLCREVSETDLWSC